MFTAVVEAYPVIVLAGLFAGITCFISNPITEFAGIDTVGTTTTPSIAMVALDALVAVLEMTILVTVATAEVDETV